MPYLDGWLADVNSPITPEQITTRAIAAWNAIQDEPSAISFFTTDSTWQAAQTVRVEPDNTARPVNSPAGMSQMRYVTIFGIRGHPTIPNTVVERGWRFWIGPVEYQCLNPIIRPWEVEISAVSYG